MSTEAPNPNPTTTTPIADPAVGAAPIVGDQKPAEAPKVEQPNLDPKAGDKPAEDSLLFKPKADVKPGDKPADDKKPDAPKELTPAEQRQALLDKKIDPKELEGKTDEEIKKMFDEQAAKDAEADAGPKIDFEALKTSDGSEINASDKDWLKKYATDNKLTQEQTQALVEKGVEMQQQNLKFWHDTKKTWLDEVKADPVIGGANLDKTVANVEDVIQKFAFNKDFGGSPELLGELQQDLMLLGLGVKKSFIRLMSNIHKATADDTITGKGGSNPPKKDLASRMYPSMKSET